MVIQFRQLFIYTWCLASKHILNGWSLNLKWVKRACSGDLWQVMYLLLLQVTGLCNGWMGGIVVRCVAAWWHQFSTSSMVGSKKVQAFRVSVGEVWRAPVIAIVPLRCMITSCWITFAEPIFWFWACMFSGGPHQISAPYRILGSTMLMYSQCVYLGVIPQLGLVIHLIWAVHFEPFSIVWACCAFQLRCWSIMMPKYFMELDGGIVMLGRVRLFHFIFYHSEQSLLVLI